MEKKALSGLKILDFTRVYAGPYCTMLLGDLGAEVIKIEKIGEGDDTRQFMPMKDGESGYFAYLNRNKKSVTLNLKQGTAVDIIKKMAKWADIVVENFSPGVMEKLGLGYEALKEANPRLIYGSISGFGQTGPYAKKPAYDVVCQAMGGFMDLTGDPEGKPYKLGPSIVDASAGIHMAFALMAAVYHRDRTGEGQYVDVSMMDTAFSTLENFVVTKTITGTAPTRNGNANLGSAPFNTFLSKDGYVAIAVANNSLFEKFTTLMDRKDLQNDERYKTNFDRKINEAELNGEVQKWVAERTTAEICALLDEKGIPVGPILGIDQLVEDPQIKEREMLVEIDHPVLGTVQYPGNPLKYSETKVETFMRAPLLGEHSEEVLSSVLQMNQEEIKELTEKGIV